MSRKKLFAVICGIAVIPALLSMSDTGPDSQPSPAATNITPVVVASTPSSAQQTSYRLCLAEDTLILYTLDETGCELESKSLDYIDILSLQPSQLDLLTKGISFESREAVAMFVQDLDS